MSQHYIFGYGSLVDVARLRRYLNRARFSPNTLLFCHLRNYRRCWNVAMDNSQTLPVYKYYVDAATGQRPTVYVTSLNIYPAVGSKIYGMLFAVSAAELARLDQRERNYRRIDITGRLDCAISGQAWIYSGLTLRSGRHCDFAAGV